MPEAMEELLNSLTDEQKAHAKSLTTTEEQIAYAKELGIELSDDQLEAISGGIWGDINCLLDNTF